MTGSVLRSALVGASSVAEGLEAPWSVAFVDGTALVSERDSGRVLELAAADDRIVSVAPPS